MTPNPTPREGGAASFGALLVAIVLAGCGGATTTTPSPTPIPSPSAPPSAAVAVAPSVAPPDESPPATTSPTATPEPTLRTDFVVPPYADLVKLFAYDTKEPLGYTVTYQEQVDGVTVQDITYPSGGAERFGKLVIPDGKGPFPTLLYAAGYGVAASFFVPEMVAFAKDGYAGLALENRPTTELYRSLDEKTTVQGYRDYVADLRRGLDLLGTIPTVDAKRLGFVGHSLGCAAGSILSGLEARIRAYVLMSCGGYVTDPDWSYCPTDACFTATEEDRARYQERLAVLNPANYIGHNTGAAFLVQASKTDMIASQPSVEALFAAAPEPKTIAWYADTGSYGAWTMGGHGLGCTSFGACDPSLPAFADHRAWLKERL